MSHDRGCWHCDADTMADKRECFNRNGHKCVKRSLFITEVPLEPPKQVFPSPDALKAWAEPTVPSNAEISATDAIMFALTIEDFLARGDWLERWALGEYADLRREWPEFDNGAWRKS